MKVSIITATYNSAATIKDTLESVNAQEHIDIEHIIVDGLSEDGTLDLVKQYGKRVKIIISEPDKGIYDAMNKGIQVATGDVIGILNSDDFFTSSDVISTVVTEFKKDSELEGVFTNLYYVQQNQPSKISRHWISKPYKEKSFFKGWHPPHPTLYFRREIYEKYGLFDLNFSLAADFELMLRFFERYKIRTKHLNIPTVRMRLGGATSKDWNNVKKQNIECIKAFKINGFRPPLLYPIYRLFPKLLQYFK